jgi:ferrous iron transport protein A
MQNSKAEISILLGKVPANTDAVVKSISGGRHFVSKAIGMGIVPGSGLSIVRNHKIGPIIVFLRDSFIAISRREAGNIRVEVSP